MDKTLRKRASTLINAVVAKSFPTMRNQNTNVALEASVGSGPAGPIGADGGNERRGGPRMRKSGIENLSQDDKEWKGPMAPLPPTDERKSKEDWIGRQLRRVFDDALNEPMPDDIMSLLERIDDDPDNRGTSGSGNPGKGAA